MHVGEHVMGTIHILVKDTKMHVRIVLEGIKHLFPYVNNESKRDTQNSNAMPLSIVQNDATILQKMAEIKIIITQSILG